MQRCRIWRWGPAARTDYGERVRLREVVASNVPCTFTPTGAGDDERTPAGRVPEQPIQGFFPRGTDVRRGDVVEITSGPLMTERQIEIESVRDWGEGFDTEALGDISQEKLPVV